MIRDTDTCYRIGEEVRSDFVRRKNYIDSLSGQERIEYFKNLRNIPNELSPEDLLRQKFLEKLFEGDEDQCG